MTLILTPLSNIPLIRPGDNLAELLLQTCRLANLQPADNDIFVITSKIISKSEGRFVNLAVVTPSEEASHLALRTEKDPRLCELILHESNEILRARPGTVIVEHRLGFVCANAGIDHSNVAPPQTFEVSKDFGSIPTEEWVLLLPEDPDKSAAEIRAKLEVATGKLLGVMIVDSQGRAWRLGTVGACIGLSGIPGVVDERGWQDLFGYTLRITIVGVADELAAAASLVMGQAAEGMPVIHVRGFPYPLREGSLGELLRPKEQDLFR